MCSSRSDKRIECSLLVVQSRDMATRTCVGFRGPCLPIGSFASLLWPLRLLPNSSRSSTLCITQRLTVPLLQNIPTCLAKQAEHLQMMPSKAGQSAPPPRLPTGCPRGHVELQGSHTSNQTRILLLLIVQTPLMMETPEAHLTSMRRVTKKQLPSLN